MSLLQATKNVDKMLYTEHFLNVLSALLLYENGVIIHEKLCYKLSYSGATIVLR